MCKGELGACVGAGVPIVASLAAFGVEPWRIFFAGLSSHAANLLAHARPDLWPRVPTTYVLARELGANASSAWVVHALFALLALGLLVRGLRLPQLGDGRRALLLCAANLLSFPYVWDYDLVILMVPALLIWRDRGEPMSVWLGVALYGLASAGSGLRQLTILLGLQIGPLLWLALLAWSSWSPAWPSRASVTRRRA